MALTEYRKKRDFNKTREPQGGKASKAPIFVVQEHHASHLHYDFRLEAFGVLKSWAVPKGPSTHVGEKRLAVEVEDHPIDYATFKGKIPEGEYGAGTVKIWDHGTWNPPDDLKDVLQSGHLEFELKGRKLKGKWLLQRTHQNSGRKSQWLLIKRHDEPKTKGLAKSTAKLPGKTRHQDPFPAEISPQLALLVDEVPAGDRYIHEIKLDGYRTLAQLQDKDVTFLTRSGLDWTEKYAPLDKEIKTVKAKSAIFDGEIVVLDENGRSNFSDLQAALKDDDMSQVKYYIFDLLYFNGQDLRAEPLEYRKQILKKILQTSKSKQLVYNEHVRGQGEELMAKAVKLGLEGIVSKDRTLPYHAGRNASWQKIKTSKRQELVVGGYTDPEGSRKGLGALLMGVYEGKNLKYIGRVGTGFNEGNTADLVQKLEKLESTTSPFDLASPRKAAKVHWVKPKLVAEIEFKDWTGDGVLRHASFLGLREDKSAREVAAEKPKKISKSEAKTKRTSKKPAIAGQPKFTITHPDRLVYPKDKIKKIDVANYYKSVAPWMLAHIANRPLSFLRCPDQAGQNCFFQKHAENPKLTELREDVIRDQKVGYIDSELGLLQLVQWGVLEPHVWQCHMDQTAAPDQIIFDLDPDPAVPWKEVVLAAEKLKDLLERLELKSYLKTTGGKGLHLHVPIAPLYSWEKVKTFSKSVCQQLDQENPGKFLTKSSKKERKKKIFLDYLRNGFGATAVAPYSLRSKDHATVAMPIPWTELRKLKGAADFDMKSALKRLAHQKKDPWEGYQKMKQKIQILKPEKL